MHVVFTTMCRSLRACLLLWLLPLPLAAQEQYLQLKAAIQVSSTISEGQYSLKVIARTAREKGIEVLIPADRSNMRWEYGLRPLPKLIRKKVEHPSILSYGASRYLSDIASIKQQFQDLIVIPGLEATPHYYWQGSPLAGNLTMYGWHKHLLVMGLEDVEDYRKLPVIGNEKGLRTGLNLLSLWPLLLFAGGFWCLKRRKYHYRDSKGKPLGPYSARLRIAGIALILISLLFFINNWPFCNYAFNQYSGDLGTYPYQNFIDYVSGRGGLVFWLHPEAGYERQYHEVDFFTPAHPQLLMDTTGYTGFALLYEGAKTVGSVGGIWDKILLEYCRGLRQEPVWAIGALGFESGGLSERLSDLQTVILAKARTASSVLEAMRLGRMYVASGEKSLDFRLSDFLIQDESGGLGAVSGDELALKGFARIHIAGGFSKDDQPLTVTLIKNASPVNTFKVQSPFDITYVDQIPSEAKSYYRLVITSRGLIFFTNPIFINY